MASTVTNLNSGSLVQSKIFNDSLNYSTSYGNTRDKVVSGTIGQNTVVQFGDICRLKAPESVCINLTLTAFATDGTNSSQFLISYLILNQLTVGGAISQTPFTNDILINVNNGVVTALPIIAVTYTSDPANNGVSVSFATVAGTQQRPCRYVAKFSQIASSNY